MRESLWKLKKPHSIPISIGGVSIGASMEVSDELDEENTW